MHIKYIKRELTHNVSSLFYVKYFNYLNKYIIQKPTAIVSIMVMKLALSF